jgi:hypothetical protein
MPETCMWPHVCYYGVMKKRFEVKQAVAFDIAEKLVTSAALTAHFKQDRQVRAHHCRKSPVYAAYLVDTGHPSGMEVHVVLHNAEVHIFNVRTAKRITVLFARPGQIKRYGIDNTAILNRAHGNCERGLNKI